MTFRELWTLYRAACVAESVHTQQSLAERDYTFGRFLEWRPTLESPPIGDMKITEAKKFQLRDFISANPGWRSSSTRKAKANQINAMLNWGVDEERIDRNPFRKVAYDEAPPRPALEDECLSKILAGANKRFERFMLFLRLTAMRLGSAADVEWADVHWDLGCIVLPPHKHKGGKRTGKPLTVALVDEAVELLKKVQAEDFFEGVIFRNNHGRPWDRGSVGLALRRLKEKLGIKCKATTHGIRHFIASEAVREREPMKGVAQMLGHSSQAITEKQYVHVDGNVEMMRQALEASLRKRRKG
jgi:integrase